MQKEKIKFTIDAKTDTHFKNLNIKQKANFRKVRRKFFELRKEYEDLIPIYVKDFQTLEEKFKNTVENFEQVRDSSTEPASDRGSITPEKLAFRRSRQLEGINIELIDIYNKLEKYVPAFKRHRNLVNSSVLAHTIISNKREKR